MGQLAVPRLRRKNEIQAMKAPKRQKDDVCSDFVTSRLQRNPPTRVPVGTNVIINTIKGTNKNIQNGTKSNN